MATAPEPADLVGSLADERLLDADAGSLPAALGRPEALAASRARAPVVAAGATLTGLTLVGGVVLALVGLISAFASGLNALNIVLIVLGIVLVSTHWGWVHVAELTANTADARRARAVVERRRAWLVGIAPHTHHEVHTEVGEDGSIAIVRARYVPVASAEGRFSFVRQVDAREFHSEEEPAAVVTERAERLRREAALATERELERYLQAAERLQTVQLLAADERERLLVRRAASLALSERINANLREPPLQE